MIVCFGFYLLLCVTCPPRITSLSLHDALPIWRTRARSMAIILGPWPAARGASMGTSRTPVARSSLPARRADRQNFVAGRSEEHTSELQSRLHLVCRPLLEKKKYHYNK